MSKKPVIAEAVVLKDGSGASFIARKATRFSVRLVDVDAARVGEETLAILEAFPQAHAVEVRSGKGS